MQRLVSKFHRGRANPAPDRGTFSPWGCHRIGSQCVTFWCRVVCFLVAELSPAQRGDDRPRLGADDMRPVAGVTIFGRRVVVDSGCGVSQFWIEVGRRHSFRLSLVAGACGRPVGSGAATFLAAADRFALPAGALFWSRGDAYSVATVSRFLPGVIVI